MTVRRPQAPTIRDVVSALTRAPYVKVLAQVPDPPRLGRKRIHPPWVLFAYAALIRHYRSANHTDSELQSGVWKLLQQAAAGTGLDPPGDTPFAYRHFTYQRDRLVYDPDTRLALASTFTETAIDHARRLGLLNPNGPGSVTYPHPSRTIYGDGTVLRPIYRPPKPHSFTTHPTTGRPVPLYLDGATGQLTTTPSGRFDPSAADHGRYDGPINGNNFVIFSTRGADPGSRVLLGFDRVPAPGKEADTAIDLIRRIHETAGPGIQAVAYDGALQGVHIKRILETTGLLVVNKVAAASRTQDGDIEPKRRPIGIHHHPNGRGQCSHVLHAVNGSIVEVDLADDGQTVDVATATRRQVKRSRRKSGDYRFNLGVTLPCGNSTTTIWLNPYDDPEHIRLLPPEDPNFSTIYNLRNDAESLNSQFKRSLLVDRATSVGWERQLFDLLGFAVLHNSLSWD